MTGLSPLWRSAIAIDRDDPGFGERVQSILRAYGDGRVSEARHLAEGLARSEIEALVAIGDQTDLLLDVPPDLVAVLLDALVDTHRYGMGPPSRASTGLGRESRTGGAAA